MGQKIHPLGLRLGVSQPHRAKWCTSPKNYAYFVQEDLRLRKAVVEIANARQSESLPPQRSSGKTKPRPKATKPVAAKPGARKPVAAKSKAAKPGARKPVAAKPKAAKPGARKSTGRAKTSTLSPLDLYRREQAKRLKPKAVVRTMFHTSMFRASLGDAVEISDIYIHRRRLHHDTDRSKGSLDVIEIYVHTTTPVQLIHGTDRFSLTASVVRYQQALERVASAPRPKGAPRVRVLLNVYQIHKPDRTAAVLASRLITRLEKRENFRSALKRVLQEAREDSVDGIKIQISGRLNGAEIARTEWVRHGSVPLQTLRANLDYSYQTAKTTYGILGIKVWTYQRGVSA